MPVAAAIQVATIAGQVAIAALGRGHAPRGRGGVLQLIGLEAAVGHAAAVHAQTQYAGPLPRPVPADGAPAKFGAAGLAQVHTVGAREALEGRQPALVKPDQAKCKTTHASAGLEAGLCEPAAFIPGRPGPPRAACTRPHRPQAGQAGSCVWWALTGDLDLFGGEVSPLPHCRPARLETGLNRSHIARWLSADRALGVRVDPSTEGTECLCCTNSSQVGRARV